MADIVAEREIFVIFPKGEKKKLNISLGKPYQTGANDWACPVLLEGMYKNLQDVHGIDSWQALTLAMSLIQQLLRGFLADGGKVYWEEGGEEISLKDIFPFN